MSRDNCWGCKIGFADFGKLPMGADLPMRDAVARAFKEITGHDPYFILSGWSEPLTDIEAATIGPPPDDEPRKPRKTRGRRANVEGK